MDLPFGEGHTAALKSRSKPALRTPLQKAHTLTGNFSSSRRRRGAPESALYLTVSPQMFAQVKRSWFQGGGCVLVWPPGTEGRARGQGGGWGPATKEGCEVRQRGQDLMGWGLQHRKWGWRGSKEGKHWGRGSGSQARGLPTDHGPLQPPRLQNSPPYGAQSALTSWTPGSALPAALSLTSATPLPPTPTPAASLLYWGAHTHPTKPSR